MKITKKTIEKAKEIRKEAAKKWACPVNEIDWVSCVGMAMKGEELEKLLYRSFVLLSGTQGGLRLTAS